MLTNIVESALKKAFLKYSSEIIPTVSLANKKSNADFQCNDVLRLAAKIKQPPIELAKSIAGDIDLTDVAKLTVSGPGFINIQLEDKYILTQATKSFDENCYIDLADEKQTIVLDYGAPNVAKALHVGHLRSFVIGESVRRILLSLGHEVISDIHYGDWGLPIGKLFLGMQSIGLGKCLEDVNHPLPEITLSSLGEMYRAGHDLCSNTVFQLNKARELTLKLQSKDQATLRVWQHVRTHSLDAIACHIKALGVHFDTYYGESDAHDDCKPIVQSLLKAKIAKFHDGAIIAPTHKSLPHLLLETQHKTALYATTDLVTIAHRIKQYQPNKIIYFTDMRQMSHFDSLFAVANICNRQSIDEFREIPELIHAPFGTVKDKSGKSFSTREGEPALLEDMINIAIEKASENSQKAIDHETAVKIAMAALKFSDLSSDRKSGYVFDLDAMLSFNGKTGPYLQYACVRISSLIEKAKSLDINISNQIGINDPLDRELALSCLKLSISAHNAANSLQAKEVCDACYSIATCISQLYSELDILKAGDKVRDERLSLLVYARNCLLSGLYLLGIDVPDKM